MKITVIQEDIDLGDAKNCSACPIARAAKRVPELGDCAVSNNSIRSHLTGEMFVLPKEAMLFIDRFDAGKKVVPFQFEVVDRVAVSARPHYVKGAPL
jgi:hypothetical protein